MQKTIKLDPWQERVMKEKGDICLCTGRQVGKSQTIGIKAARHALENPNHVVIIGAALARQATHIFWMVKDYLQDNYPNQIKGRMTMTFAELTNGSQIRCVPVGDDGLGIRGFTANVLIIDEAAFVNPRAWSGIRPVLATTKGQLILLSTPFGTEGYFAECFNNPRFYHDHISSEDCPRISKEFLEEEKKTMTKLQYQQEYLGLFVGGLQRFIPEDLIEARCIIDPDKPYRPIGRKYQGLDLARMGGDETVSTSGDKVSRNKLIQYDMEIPEGQTLTNCARWIIHKDIGMNHKRIFMDDGGLGVGVFDILHDDRQTKNKVVGLNNASREIDKEDPYEEKERKKPLLGVDMSIFFKMLLEQGKMDLLDDPRIKQSLRCMQMENENGVLKIHGNYTHIFESLKRLAHCMKDKSLNITEFCKGLR